MKKKFFAACAAVAAALMAVAGFAGCKPDDTPVDPSDDHQHVYGDWIQGPETHWRECEICHVKFAEGKHIYRYVTGLDCSLDPSKDAVKPTLKLTAPEGETRDLYVKEIWACIDTAEGKLRVGPGTNSKITFYNFVEIDAAEGGWQKADMGSSEGFRLRTYSYFGLQAVGVQLKVNEIVFLANDAQGTGELVLLKPEIVDAPQGMMPNLSGLIDYQQFPKEKRACYTCYLPAPEQE